MMKLREFMAERTAAHKMYDDGNQAGAIEMMNSIDESCGDYSGFMNTMADSMEYGLGNIHPNMNDCPFPKESEFYDSAFRAAGINRFTISSKSTGLLEFMESMKFRGWHVIGMTEVFTHQYDEHKSPAIVIDLGE